MFGLHGQKVGYVVAALALMLLGAAPARAQGFGQDETPAATARLAPATLQVTGTKPATLAVTITAPAGHHAYLDAGKDGSLLPIAIDLSALEGAGLQVREVARPKGEQDDTYGARVLRGDGIFRYRITATPRAKAGTRTVPVTVRSQVCNDANGSCYFPNTDTHSLRVAVEQVAATTAPPPRPAPRVQAPVPQPRPVPVRAATPPPVEITHYTPRTTQAGHGLLVWLLLAFVAGLLMNIMPCVLPVVSIKVLSFVEQAGESRRRVLAMGLVFAAGMITVFLALAGAAILFGLGWGQQFQSQTFLIVMIALVFAFALSLFGVFEFGVPQAVGALAARPPREGYGSVFLKGVLATLLATPCSGPLLGSTLAWTLTQPPAVVLLVFGMLGVGMALPYVVLTAQPALLSRLPRPGAWMDTFKQIMGFLLIGTVVYLMISLDPQLLLYTVMLLVFVALGAWVWGQFAWRPASGVGRALLLAAVLAVVAAGAYLSFHTLRGAVHPPAAALAWEPFDEAKLQQYAREGRSVMLDFTADWCANCAFNEVRVYNAPAVRGLLAEKRVVAMKADLTREGPATDAMRALMARLGARSIPFLAVFPGDEPTRPYTLYDLVTREQVNRVLSQLPDTK
jgi:thiol:disulfide interchange protein